MTKKAKRYNKVSLDELSAAAESKERIEISKQDAMKANRIVIIKRDGRKQPFNTDKLRKVCMWACDDKDWLADELIRDTEIKLHKEMNIKDMFQQIIVTAVNKVSMIGGHWEDIAAKLQLVSIYKETHNISNASEYPSVSVILEKGLEHRIYDKASVKTYTSEELTSIDNMIKPERDLLFNYKGLVTFFDK